MAKSLCILHDSDLRYLNVEDTAKQLCQYFKKNVAYRIINYFKDSDKSFNEKDFLKQYDNLNYINLFPEEETLIMTKEKSDDFNDYCYQIESKNIVFDLYPSCVENYAIYFEWYLFNRNFLFKKDSSLDKIVKDFRQKVYRQVQLFGGKEALYFSESNVPEAIYENINWTDLKSKIFKENKGDILDIPEFFQKNKQERLNYPVYINRALTSEEFDRILNEKWQLNVGIRDDYKVFFDDFRDLI